VNQPPDWTAHTPPTRSGENQARSGKNYGLSGRSARWRRPPGVAEGTWDYVTDRSIADHYDAFVADTPLCRVDEAILQEILPQRKKDPKPSLESLEVERNPVVFDFGCGTGRAAFPLADRGYRVVAVDLSQRMLQVVNEKWRHRNSNSDSSVLPITNQSTRPIQTLRANLVQLDCIAENVADYGICLFSTLGMIQGSDHRSAFLRHAHRIIRPGGGFLIHVHHRWAALREYGGVRSLFRSFIQSLAQRKSEFGDTVYAYRGLEKMFMHRFSKYELIADLKKSGWQVEKVWRISIDGSTFAKRFAIPGGYIIHAKSGKPTADSDLRPIAAPLINASECNPTH